MDKIFRLPELGSHRTSFGFTCTSTPITPMFFRSIPPERMGLNGEYDHSGLAQRVRLKLTETFGTKAIAPLSVTQRGRVVVLAGDLPATVPLAQVVQLAAAVDGADEVETYGVQVQSEPAIAC